MMNAKPLLLTTVRTGRHFLAALFVFSASQNLFAVPAITATQDDGTPAATRKLVGETITYTTTITNTAAIGAGNDATSLILTNPTPTNTTDTGSVTISPIAFDDTYPQTVIGNVSINSASIPYSVFSNDFAGTPAVTTISAFDSTSAQGGTVSMTTSGAGAGQFTYNPPRGYEGADSFTYTLSNALGSSVGTVTLNVSGMVWFINNNGGACGSSCDGRLSNPYTSLSAFNTANGLSGGLNPDNSDNIFIYESGTGYSGAVTLRTGQKLIGQDSSSSVAAITGLTPPSGSAGFPPTNTGGNTANITSTLTLGSGNTVNGLSVNNGGGNGIAGSAVGTLTLADINVSVTGGTALNLSTSGTVTATGTNTLNSTNGTALSVANVNIGAGNLTFRSISSGASAADGIILNTTGSSGGLIVTGNGGTCTSSATCTGGTISNKTGADGSATQGTGIFLSSTSGASLSRMQFNDFQNHAIKGTNVTGFSVTNSNFSGTSGTSSAGGSREGHIHFDNLFTSASFPTATVDGCTLGGTSFSDNLRVFNTSGTLDRLVVNNTTFGAIGINGNDSLVTAGFNDGTVMKVTVTNCTLTNAIGSLTRFNVSNSGTLDVVFRQNKLSNNNPNFSSGGGLLSLQTGGTGSPTVTYDISCNRMRDSIGIALLVANNGGGGNSNGSIVNNVIGVAGSGGLTGSTQASGIKFYSGGSGTHNIMIANNDVRRTNEVGIFIQNNNGSATVNASVFGNIVAEPGNFSFAGLNVDVGALGSDTSKVNIVIGSVGTGSQKNDFSNGDPSNFSDVNLSLIGTGQLNLSRNGSGAGTPAQVIKDNNLNPATTNTGVSGTVTLVGTLPATPPVVSGCSVPPLLFAKGGVEAQTLIPCTGTPVVVVESKQASPRSDVGAPAPTASGALTARELDILVATARTRWEASGLTSEQLAALRALRFEVSDLPAQRLGEADANVIRVSAHGAGLGWFVGDAESDRNFAKSNSTRRYTEPTDAAAGRVDLLTAILHEMGHALGLPDSYEAKDRDSLMYGFLTSGERRWPAKGEAIGAVPGSLAAVPHFLGSPVNIGTLPAGKSVKIQYAVTVGPISGNPQQVSSQGTVSGGNFSNVLTDDPTVGGASDPTVTLLGIPPTFTSANSTTFTVGAMGNFNVTANAAPGATFSTSGLPTGVSLSGAGLLSGAPGAGTGGIYNLTITATNGINPAAMQSFTLTVNEPPAITSANSATFVVGTNGSFTVTKSGFPAPTLMQSGTLPSGVTFTAATGVLSGAPAPGTGGTYPLTFTASNGIGSDATQNFTLTVNEPPAITSANSTTFVVGTNGNFTVMRTGVPTPTLSTSGALPSGLMIDLNSGLISGTPAANTGGIYPITITASNGVGSDAMQSFTLTVNQPAAVTSAASTTFTVGTAGSFTVTQSGFPVPTLSQNGTLPGGVTFTPATGVLSGTPAANSGGTYPITFTASNGIGADDVQNFTLTVNEAPAITSANSTTFVVGTNGSFTVTRTGFPASTLMQSGTLPTGVTFDTNTGVLSGTPAAGTGGTYPLTFTASNGVGSDATQNFTLTVNQAPAFTSANSATFVVGTNGSFTVVTSGFPAPALGESGALPSNLSFQDNGDGTGTLSGMPNSGTGGTYSLTFLASNGVGRATEGSVGAQQSFTLTVNEAPVITSANNTSFTVGNFGSFTVTGTGFPAPTVGLGSGTLPSGVTFNASVLSGTPASGTAGSYPLQFTASNGVGSDDVQNFNLTVNDAVCVSAPTNLTAWFPGEGDATDVKGGLNGTALNGAGFAAGKVGQGFTFNGSTAVVQVPDNAAWNFGANDFTVETWVKFNVLTSQDILVGHSEGTGSVNKWIFWRKNGAIEFHLNGSAVSNITSDASFAPTVGQWYHVAVVRSANTYKFYVDGAQNGTDRFDSNTVPTAVAPLTLGQAEALTSLDGMLDEVQIFNRALSGAEIASVYNASIKGLCFDAPAALSAVSRKTHTGVGDFDVPLPLTGTPGVECRTGGANGDHTVVVTFNNVVTAGSASVSAGNVIGSPTFSGNALTINVTGVPNAQSITLTLSNVTDGFGQTLASSTVPMQVLLGDVNASLSVNASDIAQVKANSGGSPVNGTNFRNDVNADGSIGASDVSLVKAAAGTVIP